MIRNLVNNKIYIGQSTNVIDRMAHHKSSLRHNRHESSFLQRSWNKYGEENFEFSILEECEEKEQDERERYYIALYDSTNRSKGYNRETGGSLFKHFSDDLKAEMSRKRKGMFAGENNPMYGRRMPHSDGWREKMSKRFSGSGNPMYGVHRIKTPEECEAISQRMQGENNSFYGKHHTEEARRKIGDTKKKTPVRCVETGIIYESTNEARRQTGIHNASILRAAKNHLTAGGYHWELVVA